jgi:hypothetical protein
VRGRHLTTGVTLVVLLVIVAVGAVVGARALFAPLPGDDTVAAGPGCVNTRVQKGQRVTSSQVQVSVFNASKRAGLADRTMLALTKRGFTRGDVSNAPQGSGVVAVQVWSTETDDAAARLVARQLGRNVKVRTVDTDLGPGVDVLVGRRFRGLVKADRTLVAGRATSACRSPGTPSPSG